VQAQDGSQATTGCWLPLQVAVQALGPQASDDDEQAPEPPPHSRLQVPVPHSTCRPLQTLLPPSQEIRQA
jgi:hypothetical protein